MRLSFHGNSRFFIGRGRSKPPFISRLKGIPTKCEMRPVFVK
jgi:hypothetical protein